VSAAFRVAAHGISAAAVRLRWVVTASANAATDAGASSSRREYRIVYNLHTPVVDIICDTYPNSFTSRYV